MTSVLTRWLAAPDQRAAATDPVPRTAVAGMLATGAFAGLAAAAAGLIFLGALIGLAWIVEPAVGGSILGPARLSAQAWLLGHGADVSAAGVQVAMTPLGLTALLMVCCWYAACWAGRRAQVDSLAEITIVLLALVLSYTAVGVGLTLLGSTSGAEIALGTALPGILGLSALTGAGALSRTAGHGRLIHDLVRLPSRAVSAGMGAGVAMLLAAGVGTLGIAIAVDRAGFAALTDSLAPGWTAGIGVFVLSLFLLPNAAVYAIAVLMGPGFAVGSGTTVSALEITLGTVPGVPLVAALPDSPAVPLGLLLGLAVPVLCGLAVGAVVARRLDGDVGPLPAAGWAVVAALGLAVTVGLAQLLAGGSLGDQGLATIGAAPMAVAAAAAVLLVPPAALSAAVVHRRPR